jgi:GTP cyclohydrolase I
VVYVPSDEVFGLSKFARVVNVFARRLQLQERLTEELADYLFTKLKTKGLLVMIEAIHTCALVRGVEEPLSMVTLTTRGQLSADSGLRDEALKIIKTGKTSRNLRLLKP